MSKLMSTVVLFLCISNNAFSQTKNVNQFGNNNIQNITIQSPSTVNINTKTKLSKANIDTIVTEIRQQIRERRTKKDTIQVMLNRGGNQDVYFQLIEELPNKGFFIESKGDVWYTTPIKALYPDVDIKNNILIVVVGS